MHPVSSYCTDISRFTVNTTLNLYKLLFKINVTHVNTEYGGVSSLIRNFYATRRWIEASSSSRVAASIFPIR